MNVFDIIKSINEKTKLDLSREELESLYQPWIVNKGLSFTPDTLLFANLMNQNAFLPKLMQYAFFYHGVPKGRRFGKWHKKEKPEDVVDLVKNVYDINITRAQEVLDILTDEQIKILRQMKGGKS
jgi:hypothetical protein